MKHLQAILTAYILYLIVYVSIGAKSAADFIEYLIEN